MMVMDELVVLTLIFSLESSFFRAWMRSVSLMRRLAILVIFVVPFVMAARTAKIMTRSGVAFMSTVRSDLSCLGEEMRVPFE